MLVDERFFKKLNCFGLRYFYKIFFVSEDYVVVKGLMILMEWWGSFFVKSVEFYYFECLDEKKLSELKIWLWYSNCFFVVLNIILFNWMLCYNMNWIMNYEYVCILIYVNRKDRVCYWSIIWFSFMDSWYCRSWIIY